MNKLNKINTYQCSKCGEFFRTYLAILDHNCPGQLGPINREERKKGILKKFTGKLDANTQLNQKGGIQNDTTKNTENKSW
jgi:hypothetical protein